MHVFQLCDADMRLLVTGCARSGTTWMAEALKLAGIDSRHESAFTPNYDHCTESARALDWTAEVAYYAAPWTPLPDTYIVHLVRDPLKVIASVANFKLTKERAARAAREGSGGPKHIERWLRGYGKLSDPLERGIVFYDGWNDLITANEVLRFEDVDPDTIQRLARIAYRHASKPEPPGRLNASPQSPNPVTWDDILRYPHGESVAEKARRWGYL